MEQHPIPTNVSSYQFKLVGDMTLKQFFQLAGGILVAILFYSSPLLPIIKWPLSILSGLLGVGLAFLPLEERPLERWIFAFFRAIYSPTIFYWSRTSVPEKLFQDEPAASTTVPQNPVVKDYVNKSTQIPTPSGNLEKAESGFLARFSEMVNNLSIPTPKISQAASPAPEVRQTTVPQELQTPVSLPTFVTNTSPQHPIAATTLATVPIQPASSLPVSQVIIGNEMVSSRQAMFSPDAAPPSPPTQANVVVGQIVDQDRAIIEGAIMEIRDSGGRPIRALRSNKVGHFIIVTPLDNGHYQIITEKDGYEFEPINFDATGVIIPPILVTGKRLSPLLTMPEVPVKPRYSIN